ncbi:MAG: hypothetical protein JOZ61_11090 [Verrucomicrobia bacterium]|nr:hypothetical protein [Verrucomicrobiota bacterium]
MNDLATPTTAILDDVPIAMLFAVFDPRVVPQEHYGQRFYHPLHRWEEPWSALQTPWSSPSFIQAPQREIYPEKSPFLTLSWESWAKTMGSGGELLAALSQGGRRWVVQRPFGLSAEGVASNAPPNNG